MPVHELLDNYEPAVTPTRRVQDVDEFLVFRITTRRGLPAPVGVERCPTSARESPIIPRAPLAQRMAPLRGESAEDVADVTRNGIMKREIGIPRNNRPAGFRYSIKKKGPA